MAKKSPGAIYGRRLREARENVGISQTDLGLAVGLDASGVSPRISRYETGKHQPKLQMQQLFAEALDLPLAYFYAESDELAQLISSFGRREKPGQRRVKAVKAKAKPKPKAKAKAKAKARTKTATKMVKPKRKS
jgi:transcriptional regulator with XRE-family HTH domain